MEAKTPKKLPGKDLALFYKSNPKETPSIYSGVKASSEKKKKDVLLIINVDIGLGDDTQILYGKDDDPEQLAEEFCKKHGLEMSLKGVLEKNIVEKVMELSKNNLERKNDQNMKSDNIENKERNLNNKRLEANANFQSEQIFNYNDFSEKKNKNKDYASKFMSEKKYRYMILMNFFEFIFFLNVKKLGWRSRITKISHFHHRLIISARKS